jgi:radical SAM protein with 4Fe4S-binding SPASM domain
LFDKIDPLVDPELGYVYGRNMLCFDPDGIVRTMNSIKGAWLGILGDSQDYVSVLRNHPRLGTDVPRWSKKGIEECEKCEIGDVCQGGYPAPKWYAYGRFDKPSPYCKIFKEVVPNIIEIYMKKSSNTKYNVSELTKDLRSETYGN